MQENMKILSKGKYNILELVENCAYREDQKNFDKLSIVNCQISPNQQNLAIISKKRQKLYRFISDWFFSITIINIISKETIFLSTIKCCFEVKVSCQFSKDSQYFIAVIEDKTSIINIFDKSEQRLNYLVFNIISIDFNYILLQTSDEILHYSLTQKEIVKQVDWNWKIFQQFIDSVSNSINLVHSINWNTDLSQKFLIIFQEKILKTIKSKYQFDSNRNQIKYFDEQQLVECREDMKQDLESVSLYDLRTSRILRKFKRDLQIQDQFKSRTITNIKQIQRCFYIFYIDENKQFIRLNLLTGIQIKLDFRIKSLKDKVINSENVYVDINKNKKKLRYFYFQKQ